MVAMWERLMVVMWEEPMVRRAAAVCWRGQAHTAVVAAPVSSVLHAAPCSLSRTQAFELHVHGEHFQ